MSVNAQEAPPKRLYVAVDPGGNQKMTEIAPDAGPQPIPDEDLETVAGGGRYGVQFHDGCYIGEWKRHLGRATGGVPRCDSGPGCVATGPAALIPGRGPEDRCPDRPFLPTLGTDRQREAYDAAVPTVRTRGWRVRCADRSGFGGDGDTETPPRVIHADAVVAERWERHLEACGEDGGQ